MTLPSESAIDKVERAFPAIWTRTGCEDWLKGLYAIDVQPLLARIAELEALVLNDKKDWETIVAANDAGSKQVADLTAERDRLKEELADKTQLLEDLKAGKLENENRRLSNELAEARKGRRDALRMLRCCREWVFEGTKLYEDIEEWIAVAYRDITKEAQ